MLIAPPRSRLCPRYLCLTEYDVLKAKQSARLFPSTLDCSRLHLNLERWKEAAGNNLRWFIDGWSEGFASHFLMVSLGLM